MKQITQIVHNKVKNPNWSEANQLAVNKRGGGFELGATENNPASGQGATWVRGLRVSLRHSRIWTRDNREQIQLAVRSGLELGDSRMQIQGSNQSGISLNLRTGPAGHATLFNQWEGALVFINKQIKTSPQCSKIFKTTDGVDGQNYRTVPYLTVLV